MSPAVLAAACCLPATGAGSGDVRFDRDVRPIFNAHCAACHGGVREAAGLNLIFEDSVRTVVEPGEPGFSDLLDRVADPDDETRMPPPGHGPRLSDEEVGVIAAWIERGAAWRRHWAFEPPVAHAPPDVSDPAWCRGPVDRFILAELDAAGLSPNPPAAPDRWLRRVSLDLVGLPPTVGERDEFLAALARDGDRAYDAAVDRLLADPHFGERWASVWLDQVRYADSRGLGQDGRRTAWPYRDWVVDALNRDLPFDEFTVKQLAGDLLPGAGVDDRVATVASRLTQSNEEGGTDDEQFRTEAVLDRVNTTWQVWQGLTMGCVQCHSHPYDPVRHAEFYAAAAFFDDTADADRSDEFPTLAVPTDPRDYRRAGDLDARIEPLRRRLWAAGADLLNDPAAWRAPAELTAAVAGSPGIEVDAGSPGGPAYRLTGTVARNTAVTLTAALPDDLGTLTAVKFTGLPVDAEAALKDAEWGFTVSHVLAELIPPAGDAVPVTFAEAIGDEPDPARDPADSLNQNNPWGFGPYTKMRRARSAAFVVKDPPAVAAGSRLKITLRFDVFELAAFPMVARRGRVEVSGDGRFADLKTDPALNAARAELAASRAERRAIPSVAVPVMRELEPHLARPTHRFGRGNMLDKLEEVSAGTPAALPALPGANPTRLDFARWLVSGGNPLTARVTANRLWGRTFGTGLVRTEEDFGSSGEPPSHPALLDDLAVRFEGGYRWSVKRLLRELVLSATYRQSAAAPPELLTVDPENRLLARGPRKRLPAETLRDQALRAAGLLTDRLHGPPARPPIPDGVWAPFSGDQWETPPPGDPGRYRRSVYTYVKRSIPHPLMASFDAPSREFCAARRPDSNTPTQALMTLNDATFTEAAAALAACMAEAGESPRDRLRAGFLRVCGRAPASRELDALAELYVRVAALPAGPPPLEVAAGVLLNLDEALTN